MAQRATPSTRPSFTPSILSSVLSGVLLGLAFPPMDWKWLAWVGLVPLLLAAQRSGSPRRAFLLGYVAGLVFFLITLHPLVSVHAWTGWAVESRAAFAARISRQWWFMQGIWIAFSLWCALFWGLWAAMLRRCAARGGWRLVMLAPCLWVLLPEWARAQTTFGFTWAFLGNAAADHALIRQLAALGGVWLLSAFIVFMNAEAAHLWLTRHELRHRWRDLLVFLGGVGLAAGYGALRLLAPMASSAEPVPVAAVQYHKARYVLEDFLPSGLDRAYPKMAREALARRAQLIVLPESIALGAMTLDGSRSQTKPPDRQVPRRQWDDELTSLLTSSDAAVILGLDTVETGRDHNTLVAWTREGSVGWYHKRRLVPFSEYVPAGWHQVAIRGRSQYAPGHGSQLIRLSDDLKVGGFICQEVLFPWVTRASVRDGATLLVSGGNDGVFADPAVAQVHADAAQLRAVETGRYLIRAMKTGISAVIDPRGGEQVRSRSSEPVILLSRISPRTEQTPYVRFGDWVVWFSLVPIFGCAILRRHDGP